MPKDLGGQEQVIDISIFTTFSVKHGTHETGRAFLIASLSSELHHSGLFSCQNTDVPYYVVIMLCPKLYPTAMD